MLKIVINFLSLIIVSSMDCFVSKALDLCCQKPLQPYCGACVYCHLFISYAHLVNYLFLDAGQIGAFSCTSNTLSIGFIKSFPLFTDTPEFLTVYHFKVNSTIGSYRFV